MKGSKRASEPLEGWVRDLAHAGDAVIETERGIVLARGALPGERVRLEETGRARGVARGRILALLEASPERTVAPCPLVDRCGGCPLMAWSTRAQLAWKRARLARALEPHGVAAAPEFVSGPMLRYRSRARLAWHVEPGRAQLGYHAAGSLQLIDVRECHVLQETLARGYAHLRERLRPVLAGRGEIALGIGADATCVAELTSEGPQPQAVYAAAEAAVARGELSGIALRVGRDGGRAIFGDPRQRVAGADGPLWAPPGGFIQANSVLNAQLVARVTALAEPRGARILELYAGHGNFSVALAAEAVELRAVETDREASDACRENFAERGFAHARAICADAARTAHASARVDAVVLDPPRAGAKELMPALIELLPARIVYVSCDLSTLRRDLTVLRQGGYRVDAAVGFDMFPQTPHLESVVRLVPG